jgi:hypothetical protein
VWESIEELEIENTTDGNYYSGIFAKPEASRPFVGTFDIASLPEGASGEVKLLRSSDKEVVHKWRYKNTGDSSNYELFNYRIIYVSYLTIEGD